MSVSPFLRVAPRAWSLALCLSLACSSPEPAREGDGGASPGDNDEAPPSNTPPGQLPRSEDGAVARGTDAGGGDGGTASADGVVRMKPAPSLIGGVTFSEPSQSFRGSLRVALSSKAANAEIRYTTDGTLPTNTSQLYMAELNLTATTQLRAQAFAQGTGAGGVSTALYIARTFDASSDLPIVIVEGYGGGKPTDKEVYKDAALMVFEPVNGTASLAAKPTMATRMGYHVRGQSSQRLPQTPYRLELWDNEGEDEDYALLGMPADSDWALIPPYYDRSLVRNPLVYELGREIGLSAPRVRFAEVYVNYSARPLEQADYLGVYWVTETIKNHDERTKLRQLRETDTALPALSGGYIFKFDQAAAEEPKVPCTGSPALPSGFGMRPPAMARRPRPAPAG